jgi:trehalose-phosphatase
MIPCLTEVLPELAQRVESAGPILLGLDFDGTVTPICSHPEDVQLSVPTRAVLDRLSRKHRVTVMLVSGRGIQDLIKRVGLPGLVYAGNHGLQIRSQRLEFEEPAARGLASSLEHLTARLAARVRDIPGAVLEPKGLSTSLHFRNVAPGSWEELARAVQESVASDSEKFVVSSGHRVLEIRPRISWNKGHALTWMIEQLALGDDRLVVYAGDDRTDEDAFASHPEAVTIKVGDPATPTAARYWLAGPDEVLDFLHWLEDRLAN